VLNYIDESENVQLKTSQDHHLLKQSRNFHPKPDEIEIKDGAQEKPERSPYFKDEPCE
jgi:hypothetical protein